MVLIPSKRLCHFKLFWRYMALTVGQSRTSGHQQHKKLAGPLDTVVTTTKLELNESFSCRKMGTQTLEETLFFTCNDSGSMFVVFVFLLSGIQSRWKNWFLFCHHGKLSVCRACERQSCRLQFTATLRLFLLKEPNAAILSDKRTPWPASLQQSNEIICCKPQREI